MIAELDKARTAGKFAIIDGPIGVGKTTLVERLSAELCYEKMLEPVKTNKYLDLFYQDMKRWGAIMQIHLLHVRWVMHQRAVYAPFPVIMDRSIQADTVFCRMLHEDGIICDLEMETYRTAYESMCPAYPDIMIFLDAPTAVCMERIKRRGRECERNITPSYIENLRRWYKTLYNEVKDYTVCLTFDWSDPDRYYNDVVAAIRRAESEHGFSWARRRPEIASV